MERLEARREKVDHHHAASYQCDKVSTRHFLSKVCMCWISVPKFSCYFSLLAQFETEVNSLPFSKQSLTDTFKSASRLLFPVPNVYGLGVPKAPCECVDYTVLRLLLRDHCPGMKVF